MGGFPQNAMIGFDFPFPIYESEGRMNMASQAQLATLEECIACFEDLEDPRLEVNRKNPSAAGGGVRESAS